MPASTNSLPLDTSASKTGSPEAVHGVISAGMHPLKIFGSVRMVFQPLIDL
jgi:hypothetical protein